MFFLDYSFLYITMRWPYKVLHASLFASPISRRHLLLMITSASHNRSTLLDAKSPRKLIFCCIGLSWASTIEQCFSQGSHDIISCFLVSHFWIAVYMCLQQLLHRDATNDRKIWTKVKALELRSRSQRLIISRICCSNNTERIDEMQMRLREQA